MALIGLLPAGDERYLFEQSVGILTDSTLAWVERQPDLDASEPIPVLLLEKSRVMRPSQTPPALRLALEDRFDRFAARGGRKLEWLETPGHPPPLSIVFHPEPGRTRAVAIWRPPGSALQRRELVQPHYRRFALLPPLVAIVLALVTRRALLSLALGAFLGAMLVGVQEAAMVPVPPGATSFPNPVTGLLRLITDYGWKRSFEDQFRVEVVGFVAALVAAIGVMTRGGAMGGMVDVIIRRARTAVGTRLAAATLGIAVFFDDYTNGIVVGNTMRPLTDRMRISREKLSYIVDSTAAPDAGLALVSTWVRVRDLDVCAAAQGGGGDRGSLRDLSAHAALSLLLPVHAVPGLRGDSPPPRLRSDAGRRAPRRDHRQGDPGRRHPAHRIASDGGGGEARGAPPVVERGVAACGDDLRDLVRDGAHRPGKHAGAG